LGEAAFLSKAVEQVINYNVRAPKYTSEGKSGKGEFNPDQPTVIILPA
jgi:hypothetical protein